MTIPSRSIIVAGDAETFASLATLLGEQGGRVRSCRDGSRTLELCLESPPDLLVIDTDLSLLPASRLVQILRSNPRTQGVDFFFVGEEGAQVEGFLRYRDSFVVRPFNPEQVLARILSYFLRRERTAAVGRNEKDVAGSLQQVSFVDLLQIFGLNRKDGVLTLEHGGEVGTVWVLGGQVVNARLGRVSGEKAFFRLLCWEEGRFSFAPGATEVQALIQAPLDNLIMEGLRQLDEMRSQIETLPGLETHLRSLQPKGALPEGARPATREVLTRLEFFPRVTDLLDACSRPDFEVLQILRILIEKGLVTEEADAPTRSGSRQPLVSAEQLLAHSEGHMDEGRSGKLLLLATQGEDVKAFLQALQGIDEFEPDNDFLLNGSGLPLGEIGRLLLSERCSLRLFSLPISEEHAPLWPPFCRGLVGVVVLGKTPLSGEAKHYFHRHAGVPLLQVVHEKTRSAKLFSLVRGDRAGLQRLLQQFFPLPHINDPPLEAS